MVRTRSFLWALLAPAAVAAGELSWQVQTIGGYDTNPAGFAGSQAQGVGWTQMKLGWDRPTDEGKLSLAYTGSVYSFVPESDWTAHQHTVSASYSDYRAHGFLLGMSGEVSGNWNRPAYSAYSYYELGWSGWMRSSTGAWPVEARMELGSRAYPESGAFDFRKIAFEFSARHQWQTRTTLMLNAGYTTRSYSNTTIDDLLAGRTQGSSYQYQTSALVGQGLTEKTGLRLSGWAVKGDGESRWREDYWQVLDDPLARTGFGGRIQLSWLAPAALTARGYVGGQRLREKYVTVEGNHSDRLDRFGEAGVIVEGLLPWTAAGRVFSWSLELNAARQTSDDTQYVYERVAAMVGIKYAW